MGDWFCCADGVNCINNVVGKMGFINGIMNRVGFVVGEVEIGVVMVLVLVKLFSKR